ncbi:neutral zinc metallopeptidase [Pedobacter sp. MC2016-14]|uniref:KPN_02809 family neutral zinc metallopeptidase n=1 Tax=Pedobacter sp. MC2016-14 TaxID=2897327 RepID=UPI001E2B3DAD|nr:neutral zinc metallopeptidase [Pedobacter sp. MC2016-14]MCD0487371.1 neutral zinc metallopeptidase [Pedobacter sp. MC2016-14]
MQWFGKGSGNIEDRRGMSGGTVLGGGLGIIVVVLGLIFGTDLTGVVNQLPLNTGSQTEVKPTDPTDAQGKFVDGVLESTNQVWEKQFQKMGKTYEEPILVLFEGSVQSACGNASAAVGPFYCPADHKVYIDLSFYNELKDRFGAAGDFAQAYVIAHEVGHHVQNLLGISDKMDKYRRQLSEKEYNKLSVKLELQADFLAGLWAHDAQNLKDFKLEDGDIEEALNAANAIGDDKLQKQAQGEVVPDAFTHGTSAQRMQWFRKGFETGDIKQGDTFNFEQL